ncbi:hypothetical protein [Caldisphaera sp.]|uniref:hypothetical protein n=1 Tax=Caldisphaera sp. TaxID=2060322 RepID=UPI0025B8E573|nr:hypothetical protein [Caldisphaera sp.]
MRISIRIAIIIGVVLLIIFIFVAYYEFNKPIKEVNVTGVVELCNNPFEIIFYNNNSTYIAQVKNYTFKLILPNNKYYNISVICRTATLTVTFNDFNNPVHIVSNKKTYFLNLTKP